MKARILLTLFLVSAFTLSAAPNLVKVMPASGSENVGIAGSIVLMFDKEVVAGEAVCSLNGEKIVPTLISKVAKFEYAGLRYSTDYLLEVPAGAILDKSGDAFAGTTVKFTTEARPEVTPKLFDFVVDPNVVQTGAKVGKTIQSAFKAIPEKSAKRFYVFIKNGVYNERLTLPNTKQNVTFIGESRDGVIIQNSGNPAVEIYGKHIYFENLTFKATNNPDVTQYNIAIYAEGEQNIYKNVRFLGHQDTQRTGGDRHYMKDCEIHGTIDFIYGSGNVFYDECYIYLEKRNKMMLESTTWDTACVIAAGSHNITEVWGHVFNHCTIDGDPTNDNRYSLGRPWHNCARAVYINTVMKIKPFAFGWTSMGNPPTLYTEYGSVDAQGNPIDLSQRHNKYLYNDSLYVCDFSPVLTAEEAAKYTLRNVLAGSDAWHPDEICATHTAPVVALDAATLTWNAVPYTICYVIRSQGKFLDATTDCQYQLPAYGEYSVEAIGEYGFSSEPTKVLYADPAALTQPSAAYTYKVDAGMLHVESFLPNTSLKLFDMTGKCVLSQQMVGKTVFPINEQGLLLMQLENAQGRWVEKIRLQ